MYHYTPHPPYVQTCHQYVLLHCLLNEKGNIKIICPFALFAGKWQSKATQDDKLPWHSERTSTLRSCEGIRNLLLLIMIWLLLLLLLLLFLFFINFSMLFIIVISRISISIRITVFNWNEFFNRNYVGFFNWNEL